MLETATSNLAYYVQEFTWYDPSDTIDDSVWYKGSFYKRHTNYYYAIFLVEILDRTFYFGRKSKRRRSNVQVKYERCLWVEPEFLVLVQQLARENKTKVEPVYRYTNWGNNRRKVIFVNEKLICESGSEAKILLKKAILNKIGAAAKISAHAKSLVKDAQRSLRCAQKRSDKLDSYLRIAKADLKDLCDGLAEKNLDKAKHRYAKNRDPDKICSPKLDSRRKLTKQDLEAEL